ncbi:PLP-dependent aminotransferase family protein [Aneurinibacillus aneurinilyticus]|uniref:PLP-dependent aminotransferase family protein n=1 Tax=Aneurinibacillus aneurinilyticus TaxID=1391 RepID=A0A848CRI3_ANEAE|nr:PLP-dependent aminotransferase family protein [Aneurinibacillus aneurinilyticus]NME97601.1 PLP-dependent aminotransferase family protein [Aneurinibacillus aneurinilyticus]
MDSDKRNLSKHLPKYQQIVDVIKGKIANGEWPIGSKIPSQRTLAKTFGVNRSTVITALDELMADGLIEGKMGMGTFVVNNTWTLLATNPPPDWSTYLKSGLHQPSQTMVQEINKDESNERLIQLSKGALSPDIFPLDKMKLVMQKVTEKMGILSYEEPKGYLPLRQALSSYVKTIGIEASPSSILIVSGALQALQLISVGLLHRGSTVLLEQPSYLYSLHVFQSAGMKLAGLPMDKQGLLPDFIAAQRKQQNKAILYSIPCFHNPTGILMSEKRRQELLQMCEEERLPIIEDDIYRELWTNEPPPAPLKARDRHGHVLYIGSLSKTLSPGLRIGWIIGPEPVIERLSDIKMQTDYGSGSISQRVAAEWLESGLYHQYLASVREQLTIRKAAAMEALEMYMGNIATWDVPEGGFFIWLKINEKLSTKELFTKAIHKGILLNPGTIYAQESGLYVRLSYAYASLLEIREGIRRIAAIIQASGSDYPPK